MLSSEECHHVRCVWAKLWPAMCIARPKFFFRFSARLRMLYSPANVFPTLCLWTLCFICMKCWSPMLGFPEFHCWISINRHVVCVVYLGSSWVPFLNLIRSPCILCNVWVVISVKITSHYYDVLLLFWDLFEFHFWISFWSLCTWSVVAETCLSSISESHLVAKYLKFCWWILFEFHFWISSGHHVLCGCRHVVGFVLQLFCVNSAVFT